MILKRDGAKPDPQVLSVVIHNHRQRGEDAIDNVKRHKCHHKRGIKAVEPSHFINELEYDHQKSQQGKGYPCVQAVVIENEDEYGKNNYKV